MSRCKLSIALAIALAGCEHTSRTTHDSAAGALPPIRVTAVQPARKTLVRSVELPGRVEAFEVAPLHAKVTGYIERIPVDIGDAITGPKDDQPGMALCELLVPELQEELSEKQALVAQSEAAVAQADAAVKLAEAGVRSQDAKVREARAALAREDAVYARWQ